MHEVDPMYARERKENLRRVSALLKNGLESSARGVDVDSIDRYIRVVIREGVIRLVANPKQPVVVKVDEFESVSTCLWRKDVCRVLEPESFRGLLRFIEA